MYDLIIKLALIVFLYTEVIFSIIKELSMYFVKEYYDNHTCNY
jgi:hypothetical protein